MDKYTDLGFLHSQVSSLWTWITQFLLTRNTLIQIAVIVFAVFLAQLLGRPLRERLRRLLENREWHYQLPRRLIGGFLPLITCFVAIFLLRISAVGFSEYELPNFLIATTARLLTAWIIIRLTTALLPDSNWSRLLSITAWFIAALHLLKLWLFSELVVANKGKMQ
jgi:hypothetical protein